jgi:adenine-specific DNA methylase
MQFDDFSKESFYRLKFRSIDSRIQNKEPNSLFKEDVAPQEKVKADIEEIKTSSTDFKVSKVTED